MPSSSSGRGRRSPRGSSGRTAVCRRRAGRHSRWSRSGCAGRAPPTPAGRGPGGGPAVLPAVRPATRPGPRRLRQGRREGWSGAGSPATGTPSPDPAHGPLRPRRRRMHCTCRCTAHAAPFRPQVRRTRRRSHGEVTGHVGCDEHDAAGRNSGNSRSGTRSRDVAGTFEPRRVRKRQRRPAPERGIQGSSSRTSEEGVIRPGPARAATAPQRIRQRRQPGPAYGFARRAHGQ